MFLVFLVLFHYYFFSVLILGRNFPGRNVQWGEIAGDELRWGDLWCGRTVHRGESSWGENRGANCGGANWNDTKIITICILIDSDLNSAIEGIQQA